MLEHYLPPGRPVSREEWAHNHWYICETIPRVARSTVMTREGFAGHVSTVFMFRDQMPWLTEGGPILWETMIFGQVLDCWQERYATPEAASMGHGEALALMRTELDLRGTPELVTVTWRGRWWKEH